MMLLEMDTYSRYELWRFRTVHILQLNIQLPIHSSEMPQEDRHIFYNLGRRFSSRDVNI